MSQYVESDRLLEKGNGSGRREVWMTYLKELLNLMDEVHRLLRPRKDNLQGMSKNVITWHKPKSYPGQLSSNHLLRNGCQNLDIFRFLHPSLFTHQ